MASRTKNHSHLAIVLCWEKKNLPFASSSRFEFDWLFGRRQARQARQARRRRWVRQEQLSVTTQSDSYLVCRAHQRWQLPSVSTSSWRRQLPIEKRLFACIWQRRARCGGVGWGGAAEGVHWRTASWSQKNDENKVAKVGILCVKRKIGNSFASLTFAQWNYEFTLGEKDNFLELLWLFFFLNWQHFVFSRLLFRFYSQLLPRHNFVLLWQDLSHYDVFRMPTLVSDYDLIPILTSLNTFSMTTFCTILQASRTNTCLTFFSSFVTSPLFLTVHCNFFPHNRQDFICLLIVRLYSKK